MTAPGGFSLAATGRDVITVILLLALAVLVYRGSEGSTGQHIAITSAFDRLACVLAMDQTERLTALQSGDPCRYALAIRRPGSR